MVKRSTEIQALNNLSEIFSFTDLLAIYLTFSDEQLRQIKKISDQRERVASAGLLLALLRRGLVRWEELDENERQMLANLTEDQDV